MGSSETRNTGVGAWDPARGMFEGFRGGIIPGCSARPNVCLWKQGRVMVFGAEWVKEQDPGVLGGLS